MQKSWGFSQVLFDIRASFSVGQYAVPWGSLKLGTKVPKVNSMSLLPRFYGSKREKSQSARISVSPSCPTISRITGRRIPPPTRRIASAALNAYSSGDLDTQSKLYSADVAFQDPTAKVSGGSRERLITSWDNLLRERESLYREGSDISFEVLESFFANRHAVYMGKLRYSIAEYTHDRLAITSC